MAEKLKYGNTNTFFLRAREGVLIDTDMFGTLPAFYKEIKRHNISIGDIGYVIATHYHPDHMGLISELMGLGIKLLLAEHQKAFVHFSDSIIRRSYPEYIPINENKAVVFSCKDSRKLLSEFGIQGEVIPTRSHSEDGIALILDNGDCFVGDLEPREYIAAYSDNQLLEDDWKRIMSHSPKHIYYAHANDKSITAAYTIKRDSEK